MLHAAFDVAHVIVPDLASGGGMDGNCNLLRNFGMCVCGWGKINLKSP